MADFPMQDFGCKLMTQQRLKLSGRYFDIHVSLTFL